MQRELFGMPISQKSKTEMFSATDLVKAGNKWRVSNGIEPFDLSRYFQNKSTKEFLSELEFKFGEVKITGQGRGKHTWVHPYLFIDIALSISPSLKIEVYSWLFDELIKNRNESGDSYKRMCGALFIKASNKYEFPKYISKVAELIRKECNVGNDEDAWQKASQEQLKHRDRIHDSIAMLSDILNNNDEAVRLGILKTIREK